MELSEKMMDDWRRKKTRKKRGSWNEEENPCLEATLNEIKNKIDRKGGFEG